MLFSPEPLWWSTWRRRRWMASGGNSVRGSSPAAHVKHNHGYREQDDVMMMTKMVITNPPDTVCGKQCRDEPGRFLWTDYTHTHTQRHSDTFSWCDAQLFHHNNDVNNNLTSPIPKPANRFSCSEKQTQNNEHFNSPHSTVNKLSPDYHQQINTCDRTVSFHSWLFKLNTVSKMSNVI